MKEITTKLYEKVQEKKANAMSCELSPEKVLEICNTINAAIIAGKTVTFEDYVITVRIAGAIPGFGVVTGVFGILNTRESIDTVKVMDAKGYIIRVYSPEETNVEIIYNPSSECAASEDPWLSYKRISNEIEQDFKERMEQGEKAEVRRLLIALQKQVSELQKSIEGSMKRKYR